VSPVLRRLLIANRGEIAVRISRACRELAVESVAVYSEADAHALHVSLADRAMPIGPPAAADSYLSIERILGAARDSGADSVHPGYGFLSENAALAAACERADLVFVGPPSAVIASMGSKIEARRLVAAAGVPVVPGQTPSDQSDGGLQQAADHVGYPLLVKASAGGGGKGMRRVDAAGDLPAAAQAARREALAAFDDGTLYVERLIERPHHVEVQVMADAHGAIVHLFERECSVQRRHQKVIEETPAPLLTTALRARITDAAVRAARAVGYRNAGTIEFLVEASHGSADEQFYFLEMNTRLQVEHPITEAVIGVDLVQAQIRVASGKPLPWTQDSLRQRGHAIEARVYAEAPSRGFVPQAGPLLLYREPRQPGIRVDSGVIEGDRVSVHYDPLLAKVIASAESREAAVARLVTALRDFPVLGIETNIPFLIGILEHPRFTSGDIDIAFLDDTSDEILAATSSPPVPPLVAAAIAAHRSDGGGEGQPAHQDWDPWSGAISRGRR
jgi:3-methylcrotonyl-CoA carboxylase alpha subunit